MKAAFLLVGVAVIGAGLWFGGVFAPPAGDLLVTDARATPTPTGAMAELTIENAGTPDQLLSVSSAAGAASLMNAGSGLPIPTGQASLATDAAHIMIAAPDAAFEDGALIPLTLTFATAGEVAVKARFTLPDTDSEMARMAHGAMQQEVGDGPAPAIRLSAEPEGDGWLARIETENFTFSEAMQDGDHVVGMGHGHIYLGGMKLGRIFSDSYSIGALPKGEHILRVTLNTNNHRAYVVEGRPVMAETIIKVD